MQTFQFIEIQNLSYVIYLISHNLTLKSKVLKKVDLSAKVTTSCKNGWVSLSHEETFLHEVTLLHGDSFTRGDTFARGDIFARRLFCTK